MNFKIENIIWLTVWYQCNKIGLLWFSSTQLYILQTLETIHIASCDLAGSGRWTLTSLQVLHWRDETLLKEAGWCGHALLMLPTNSEPSGPLQPSLTKVRCNKDDTNAVEDDEKRDILNFSSCEDKGQKLPWGVFKQERYFPKCWESFLIKISGKPMVFILLVWFCPCFCSFWNYGFHTRNANILKVVLWYLHRYQNFTRSVGISTPENNLI